MSRAMRPLSRRLFSLQSYRPSAIAKTKPTESHSPDKVLEILHEQDDLYLAAVKKKCGDVEQMARIIGYLSKRCSDDNTIHTNDQIPPHTSADWNTLNQTCEAAVEKLCKEGERIRLNVSDLQVINYPSDSALERGSVATLVKQDRDQMLLETRSEKEKMLWDLENEEAAQKRRFLGSIEAFERDLERYELVAGPSNLRLQKPVKETARQRTFKFGQSREDDASAGSQGAQDEKPTESANSGLETQPKPTASHRLLDLQKRLERSV